MDASTDETLKQLASLIEQTYKVESEYVALRQSYEGLRLTIDKVIEFLPNAIWILEHDGKLFLQNSRAKSLSSLLVIIDLKQDDYELMHENRSYLIKISAYENRFLVSATDITEQKRKENLATMGQMAAHLSHEIRNPIGSISLLTSTLKGRVKPENRAIVEEIAQAVFRIERIIKATLLFSKGVQPTFAITRWSELRSEIINSVGYYGYTKRIQFELFDGEALIMCDKALIIMMLSNFIFNAIDAIEAVENTDNTENMEAADTTADIVRVSYRKDASYHHFYICDNGEAIENESMLFEAFKSTKLKGNGLGLILSRQIAQAHGGTARYEPHKTNKCFHVSLKVEPFIATS